MGMLIGDKESYFEENFNQPSVLQQLKSTIYQSLPNLMELGVGCEIKTQTGQILKMYSEDYRYYNFFNEQVTSTSISKPLNYTYEILGRPITLPDVLLWMNKIGETQFSFNTFGQLHYNDTCPFEIDLFWNLEKYTIDEQSMQLIEFLFNLIEKKR